MSRRLLTLELAGEHVRLRPHQRSDADTAFAMLGGREEILQWLVWEGPASAAELDEHYGRWHVESDGGPDLRLAIEERASGALVGSLSLRFGGHPGMGDLGYWIGLPFQNRGLGREAVALTAHFAFRHLGAHAIHAWVFVGNGASRRVLERTGFTLARTIPGRIVKRGRSVDEWHFVLLQSEWRRLRTDFRPVVDHVVWSDATASDAMDSAARPFPSG